MFWYTRRARGKRRPTGRLFITVWCCFIQRFFPSLTVHEIRRIQPGLLTPWRTLAGVDVPVEAGSDHRHLYGARQALVDDGAENDVGFFRNNIRDHLCGLVGLVKGNVGATLY